jgi:hypothetical protein
MGGCCTAEKNTNEIDIVNGGGHGTKVNINHVFDDREVLGLTGADKIRIIVKLQAWARGQKARRQVKETYGF